MKINSKRGAERLKVPRGTTNEQGYTDLTILLAVTIQVFIRAVNRCLRPAMLLNPILHREKHVPDPEPGTADRELD
jgi:hypothetical protein